MMAEDEVMPALVTSTTCWPETRRARFKEQLVCVSSAGVVRHRGGQRGRLDEGEEAERRGGLRPHVLRGNHHGEEQQRCCHLHLKHCGLSSHPVCLPHCPPCPPPPTPSPLHIQSNPTKRKKRQHLNTRMDIHLFSDFHPVSPSSLCLTLHSFVLSRVCGTDGPEVSL